MNINVFTLCDFAQAEHGRMTIVGAFNRIEAKQAPLVYPMCALAAIIRFERIEEGEKNIRVTFIDSDGRPVMPALQKQIKVQFPAQVTDSHATMHLVLLIQQIRLPNFGEYSINLAIDGRQQASIPLFVRQSRAPQAPQPLPPSE